VAACSRLETGVGLKSLFKFFLSPLGQKWDYELNKDRTFSWSNNNKTLPLKGQI
jgi:hypothetical protein